MPSKNTTVFQDAIRLLFILVNGGEKLRKSNENFVSIFEGKAKLHAMDFWGELINKYEETQENRFLEIAKNIFKEREPDLRNIPMIRFRFGA